MIKNATSLEATWDLLRQRLETRGGWLAVVLSTDDTVTSTLRERTAWDCRRRALAFTALRPREPDELLGRLVASWQGESAKGSAGPGPGEYSVDWVELPAGGSPGVERDWAPAWDAVRHVVAERPRPPGGSGIVIVVPADPERAPIDPPTPSWPADAVLGQPDAATALPRVDDPLARVLADTRKGHLGPWLRYPNLDEHRLDIDRDSLPPDLLREVVALVNADDEELTTPPGRERLSQAIAAAEAQGATDTAATLLLRRADARAARFESADSRLLGAYSFETLGFHPDSDPAGAWDDFTRVLALPASLHQRYSAALALHVLEEQAGNDRGVELAATAAVALAQALRDRLGTVETGRSLGWALILLGDAHVDQERWRDAAAAYGRARSAHHDVIEQCHADLESEELRDFEVAILHDARFQTRWRLGELLGKLGSALAAGGQWDDAVEAYTQAVDAREWFAAKPGTPQARRNLANSLEDLGDAYLATGREADAEAAYRRCLALREELADQLETRQTSRELEQVQRRLTNLASGQTRL